MAAFITCSDIGSALIQWIFNASDEDKAKLCEVLDCGVYTQEDSGLTGSGSSKDPLGIDTSKLAFAGAQAPQETEQPELPTTIVGSRNKILGEPSGYMTIGGHSVPYYDSEPLTGGG